MPRIFTHLNPQVQKIKGLLERLNRHYLPRLTYIVFLFLLANKSITLQININKIPFTDYQILKENLTSTPIIYKAKANPVQVSYIERFAPIAQKEMQKFGIPASIKLAQGLLESQAGKSKLATHNNNHFGIKCFSRTCQKGHCSNFSDDSHKDFFRIYPSAWESYRAHSIFLQKNRYQHLQQSKDYKDWAIGLQKAGYATDPQYANKLIRLIEQLDLQQFDT